MVRSHDDSADVPRSDRGALMRLLDRIRAHHAVESVSVEPGEFGTSYFVYLKPGFKWSEQGCFGCETLREAWSLVKESRKEQTS